MFPFTVVLAKISIVVDGIVVVVGGVLVVRLFLVVVGVVFDLVHGLVRSGTNALVVGVVAALVDVVITVSPGEK